jgi:diaminopimelate decarboxylase
MNSFGDAGAYCFSMASNYNSRYLPAEVMVHQGKDYLIRKRQTIQDILHNQEIITLPEVKKNKKEAVPA